MIQPNGGFAYTVAMDDVDPRIVRSGRRIRLLEDDAELTVDHRHADIRQSGDGRYSPWGATLYFSASDNSDPRTNERDYTIVVGQTLFDVMTRPVPWTTHGMVLVVGLGVISILAGIGRTTAAPRLARGVIRFAPCDTRVILRVALFFITWRMLSLDLSALSVLVDGRQLHHLSPAALDEFARWMTLALLSPPGWATVVQLIAASLLLATLIVPRRVFLIVALMPTLLIEWAMYQYRGQMPDMDPILATLVIAACWPMSWKHATGKSRAVSSQATSLGLAFTFSMALIYFVSGWSKLSVDGPWWKTVDLEYLYASMIVWHGATAPSWFEPIAIFFQDLFGRMPWLDVTAAFSTMVIELAWPLVLVSRWARWLLAPAMVGAHLVIFLSSGIFFLPMGTLGITCVIAWRHVLARGATDPGASEVAAPGRIMHPLRLVPLIVISYLVIYPARYNADVFPFTNYCHFNWVHRELAKPAIVYRLGYWDPEREQYRPIPMNHGGFLDCWMTTLSTQEAITYMNSADGPARDASLERLRQYPRALRSNRSSNWLLGPFACPPHVVASSYEVDPEWLTEIHLLKTEYDIPARGFEATWEHVMSLWKKPDA